MKPPLSSSNFCKMTQRKKRQVLTLPSNRTKVIVPIRSRKAEDKYVEVTDEDLQVRVKSSNDRSK